MAVTKKAASPNSKAKSAPRATPVGKLGAEIDKIYLLQKRQEEFTSRANAIKAEVDKMKEALLEKFKKSELSAAAGRYAKSSIEESVVPTLEDAEAFWGYVKTNDAYDLLHKKVSAVAWRERLDAGVAVPGVKPFTRIVFKVMGKK